MDVQKRRPGPICLRSAVPPSERTLISKDLAPVNPRPGSSRRKQMLSKQLISPASAAASIKLELWPLRNPVSSIQPLIYADPPNVLTGNDRLNIHRFAAIHLAFLLKCTQGLFELSLLSSHFLRTSPRVDRNFSQISRPCKQCQGSPSPTQLRSSASEDLTLFPMLSALWAQLNWLRLKQEG